MPKRKYPRECSYFRLRRIEPLSTCGHSESRLVGGGTMGLFVDKTPNEAPVKTALEGAYLDVQNGAQDAQAKAASQAPGVAQGAAAGTKVYKTGNIVFAVLFFLLLLGIAIAAEALDWVADASKIYEFAGPADQDEAVRLEMDRVEW
jgi:hypothetical protein